MTDKWYIWRSIVNFKLYVLIIEALTKPTNDWVEEKRSARKEFLITKHKYTGALKGRMAVW